MNTVPSIVLKGIDVLIDSYGASHKELMSAVGFAPELLQRPDNLIGGQLFCDLIEHSARSLGQRFFGLQLAIIQGGSILGPLWFLMRNSATLHEAIDRLLDNFPAHTEVTFWHTQSSDQGLFLCYDVNPVITGGYAQIIDIGLGLACDSLRITLGSAWQPKAVYMKCSDPYDKGPMLDVFGKNILFNQEINAVFITAEELQRPIKGSSLLGRLHFQHEVSRRADFNSRSIAVQAENIISASLTRQACTLNFVAKCLNLNPRTLRHYLTLQGTSYQQLLTKARLNLALHYISQTPLNMGQIAERLHFSEAAVFSRFVKKHTGKTPGQFRKAGLAIAGG